MSHTIASSSTVRKASRKSTIQPSHRTYFSSRSSTTVYRSHTGWSQLDEDIEDGLALKADIARYRDAPAEAFTSLDDIIRDADA